MTLWAFDLRSSDSDIEDDETSPKTSSETSSDPPVAIASSPQPHDTPFHDIPPIDRKDQLANELDELFGTSREEQSVEYKPNPWSIAKINANARAAAGSKPPKPVPKMWRAGPRRFGGIGSQSVWSKSGFAPSRGARPGLGSPVKVHRSGGRSLRDSISAALRRGAPPVSTASELEYGSSTSLPGNQSMSPAKNSTGILDESLRVDSSDARDGFSLEHSAQPLQPERGAFVSLCKRRRQTSPGVLNAGAYIPQNPVDIPQARYSNHSDENQTRYTSAAFDRSSHSPTPPLHSHIQHPTPVLYPNEDLASGTSPDYLYINRTTPYPTDSHSIPTARFQEARSYNPITPPREDHIDAFPTTPRRAYESNHPVFSPAGPRLERNPIHPLEQVASFSPPHSLPVQELEPSPTVQLIAKYAARRPHLNKPDFPKVYGDTDACDPSSPPVFARDLPSPVSEARASNSGSGPYQNHRSNMPCTPERRVTDEDDHNASGSRGVPISRWQPVTPPKSIPKKLPMVPMKRLDPDDKPFWSTLPASRSTRLAKSPTKVTSTRFHLPGVFLGSSPLKNAGNSPTIKNLYKPPPPKRAAPEDDSPAIPRWKVTRIT